MSYLTQIGIIGFGEAGFEFAKSLKESGCEIFIYDSLLQNKPDWITERANSINVKVTQSIQELINNVSLVFVFTSSASCIDIASQCASFIRQDLIYVDCNSAAPETKKGAWDALNRHLGFVDAAVMGPVPGSGHKTPLIVSGPGADKFYTLFVNLGGRIKIVEGEPGIAATIKLVRSSFMKGLATLLIESISLAESYQITQPVLQSLVDTLGDKFQQLINRLVTGSFQHASRRVLEVEAVQKLQVEAGLNSFMVDGTIEVLKIVAENQKEFDNIEQYFSYIPMIMKKI